MPNLEYQRRLERPAAALHTDVPAQPPNTVAGGSLDVVLDHVTFSYEDNPPDPATEVRLTRAIESLSRGRSSVSIAHRLSTAERADLVLVLEHGRSVETGIESDAMPRSR